MASKKDVSLRDLDAEQLKSKLTELEKSHQEARFNKISGDSAQSNKIKEARKDIARVKTFLRQYELEIKK